MNYFTCKVENNNFITKKGEENMFFSLLTIALYSALRKAGGRGVSMQHNVCMMNLTLVLILLRLQNIYVNT